MSKFKNVSSTEIMQHSKEVTVSKGLNVVVDLADIDVDATLFLSDIIDTIYGVKLESVKGSVVGTIDKIRFKNASIYVLDRYKTCLLKVFDLDGKYLHTVGHNGNGPGEYVQPTDFYVDNNEVIVYDQFQSKLIHYNLKGDFEYEKTLPFMFIQFYKFSSNRYLMHGLNADNYHLKELLDYSLWECDSTFHVNRFGMFRKKDAYQNMLSSNNLNDFDNTLYYHDSRKDTVFSVDSAFNLKYDYIVDFGKRTPPPSIFLTENKKEEKRAFKEGQYAFGSDFAITPHHFYYNFSLKGRLFHVLYSLQDRQAHCAAKVRNDVNYLFPLSSILTAQGDTLIGYSDAMHLYENYHKVSEKMWSEMRNRHGVRLLSEGQEIVNFAKGMKIDDNPVLIFYVLKKREDSSQ